LYHDIKQTTQTFENVIAKEKKQEPMGSSHGLEDYLDLFGFL
jgi:hypothetical protein